MAVEKNSSLIMAQRLKELRTEKKLSHESLRKALIEKYEIDISIDSLKNYEVSNPQHIKAYKNEGMRVEYLRCLADFYGVSSDWVIGLSDVRTKDIDIQTAVNTTGLSDDAVIMLSDMNSKHFNSYGKFFLTELNLLLLREDFRDIVTLISHLPTCTLKAEMQPQLLHFLKDAESINGLPQDGYAIVSREVVTESEKFMINKAFNKMLDELAPTH